METQTAVKHEITIPKGCEAKVEIVGDKIVYTIIEIKKSLREKLDKELIENKYRMFYIKNTNNDIGYVFENRRKDRDVMPTEPFAEAFLAFMQLVKWNYVMNGFKELEKHEISAMIVKQGATGKAYILQNKNFKRVLNFKSCEDAVIFYNEFNDLIEVATPLL